MAERYGVERAVLGSNVTEHSPTSARRRQASAACALGDLSAPPRARAPPPPRSPSALASPPPAGARAPLSTAAHTAPRPAPPAGTHTSRYQALSCLSARLARARARLPAISSALASPPPAARASPHCCAPRTPTLGTLAPALVQRVRLQPSARSPTPRAPQHPLTLHCTLSSQPLPGHVRPSSQVFCAHAATYDPHTAPRCGEAAEADRSSHSSGGGGRS